MFHAIWSRRLEIFHLATHCNQCLLHIGISGGGVEACPIKLFLLSGLGAPALFSGRKRQKHQTLQLAMLSKKTSLQPTRSTKCPGNNQRGRYWGEIRYNRHHVTLWEVPDPLCGPNLPQLKSYSLTFRNWGVTNRTVAMRQTCSSSDDCRLRGNDSSSPLHEDVGTAAEKTFSSDADQRHVGALS